MIHRIARFEIQKENLDQAIEAIEKFVKAVNKNEDGCKLYRSLRELESPQKFTHYMIFASREDEILHRNTVWVKEFVEIIYPLMSIETIFTEMMVIGE